VKAIVVVHHGHIIAERYAPGFGPDTRMLSWSTAKSVINALTGILVRKGEISVDGPAPVAAWSNPADPRHAVSIDNLLRQTSGQPFGSSNSGFDRSTRMQFEEPDTAAYAEAAAFDSPPGKTWSYTDANYAILSGIIRDHTGGTAEGVARFAHDELFGPLGMKSATFEYDEAGNPMGGTYCLSTARDWARFGLLYLHDGAIGDHRILPQGWVEYSARPTPQAAPFGYGAGFWTNRGPDDYAQGRRRMGEPADSFYANGNYAQTVLIAPKEDLIVARFSMGEDTDGRVSTQHVAHMVGEILAELRKTGE
jgi:CubicO group peptidase (beta-lactamase class C family)